MTQLKRFILLNITTYILLKSYVILALPSSTEILNFVDAINDEFMSVSELMEIPTSISSELRGLEDINDDTSYISSYSIQFQGCHHIQQWNHEAEDDEDVRLLTKRLVRFRLVPYDQCTDYPPWAKHGDKITQYVDNARIAIGSLKNFGEYIVDLETFVEAYLESAAEEMQARCLNAQDYCEGEYGCGSDDDYSMFVCLSNCYDSKNLSNCLKKNGSDDDTNNIDAKDYAQCSKLGDVDNNGVQYYYGPYCAKQGGEIRFSVFTDDSCTMLSKCHDGKGATCFAKDTGIILPYSQENVVKESCIPCTEDYLNLEEEISKELKAGNSHMDLTNYDFGYPRNVCYTLYGYSGKCEKYMTSGVSNNSSCSYIGGIKVLTEEGTPKSRNVTRSFAADVTMGTFTIGISFLVMYVYYLKHVLRISTNNIK